MEKKAIFTENAPMFIGPYSQGIITGDLVYVSGQIPIDPKTGEMKLNIEESTKQVLENIQAVLAEAQLTLDDVVKTTVFLTDLDDFKRMNAVYETFFTKPYPARSTVAVKDLPKGSILEIECVART